MEPQLTVLHVDDDPSFLRLTGRKLEHEGSRMQVMTATTAEEAFDLLGDGRFDCLVSDSMQTADGESFVTAVRRRHPDLPLVLFTGAEWEAVADDAERAGVAAYVQKGAEDPLPTLTARVETVTGTATADADASAGTLPHVTGGLLGDEWQQVATHDWEADAELVVTVVEAVDRLLGSDDGRTPLYNAINGEALESLLRRRDDDGTTVVRFPFRGLDIAVTGSGAVAVKRADDEGATGAGAGADSVNQLGNGDRADLENGHRNGANLAGSDAGATTDASGGIGEGDHTDDGRGSNDGDDDNNV